MAEQTASKVAQIRFKGFEGEWEEQLLGELYTKIRNAFVGTATPYYTQKGHFYLQSNNVKNGEINRNTEVFINEEFYIKQKDNWLRTNDIVMVQSGHVGHTAVIPDELNNSAAHALIIISKPLRDTCSYYLNFYFQGNRAKRGLANITTGNTIKHILASDIKKFGAFFTDYEEQTKIGKYFRELDSLIGLHQRKHDKLVTLKKVMLQKMFPQPGTTTPEIRFKGFEGEWVAKKLGDSTVSISNNTLSRASLNSRSGLAKNIHYGDILVKYGEVLDVQNDDVPFVSDDALANKLKHARLQDGDVVMADAAEDEMVGKCIEIQNMCDQFLLAGLHTIALRPLDSFAPFYLGYFLNADVFHDQLLRLMQGTKVLSISKSGIKETIVYFPADLAEQQKIGTYFRTLDSLVSKHATQLQKLQQIKSACLERMFV